MPQPATLADDDPITISTVAQILRRPESTCREWRRRGLIKPIAQTPSGLAIYSRSAIEQLARSLEQ